VGYVVHKVLYALARVVTSLLRQRSAVEDTSKEWKCLCEHLITVKADSIDDAQRKAAEEMRGIACKPEDWSCWEELRSA